MDGAPYFVHANCENELPASGIRYCLRLKIPGEIVMYSIFSRVLCIFQESNKTPGLDICSVDELDS